MTEATQIIVKTEHIGPRVFRAVVIAGPEGQQYVADIIESNSKKAIDAWLGEHYAGAHADWCNLHTDYRALLN